MRKVFISYHHGNDQGYKNELLQLNQLHNIFIDRSVRDGDISDDLTDQIIRTTIRDKWLRDSTITILLCGTETRYRKHVDWELMSSMIDGTINKKSGILVIDLPTTFGNTWHASHMGEKEAVYDHYDGQWTSIENKSEYRMRHPSLPERIIDNLVKSTVKISVVPWQVISGNPRKLAWLIEATAAARVNNQYDMSQTMRRNNHYPNSYG